MCRRNYCYDHDASTSNETGPDPRTDEESTDEESTDEESTDEESMDEDDPFDSSIIVSQRADLDDDEKDHIRELLPPKDEYIGVPYVTRLTGTNLARYEMQLSQKNSDNRKKLKTKHRVGSKSYSQLSFENRNSETGEEPECIALWEITHTKNGSWTTEESKKVYEKACQDIQNREKETGDC
ncbi:hypothetical protein ACQ4PT_039864 [Festuca glaucescens]